MCAVGTGGGQVTERWSRGWTGHATDSGADTPQTDGKTREPRAGGVSGRRDGSAGDGSLHGQQLLRADSVRPKEKTLMAGGPGAKAGDLRAQTSIPRPHGSNSETAPRDAVSASGKQPKQLRVASRVARPGPRPGSLPCDPALNPGLARLLPRPLPFLSVSCTPHPGPSSPSSLSESDCGQDHPHTMARSPQPSAS